MSLSVPLEPPSKEILHISAHYLVILVKIYIFNSICFAQIPLSNPSSSCMGVTKSTIYKVLQNLDSGATKKILQVDGLQ